MRLRSPVQASAMCATRYKATANLCADPEAVSFFSVSLASLHHLVLSGHHHGRSCASPLSLLSHLSFTETKNKIQFLWGCGENHQFHWDPLERSTEECKQTKGFATLKQQTESTVRQLCNNEHKKLLNNTDIVSNNLTQEKGTLIAEGSESFNRQSTCFEGSSKLTGVECGDIGWSKNADKDNQMPDISLKPFETFHRKEGNVRTPAEHTREARLAKSPMENQQLSPLGENILGKSDMIHDNGLPAKIARPKIKALTACLGVNLAADGIQHGTSVSSSKKKIKACRIGTHRNTFSPRGMKILLTEKEKEQLTVGHKRHHGDHEVTIDVETSRDICEIRDSLERYQKDDDSAEMAKRINWSNEGEQGLSESNPDDGKVQNQTPNRKSTPSELFLCELDNCGKVFSKRQYLNYHQKYQHVNQRTFCCPVPECGRKFNFKKHLKEHEKRHSDQRDFICEFCARAFRSSSNLIIHHRIHTGEKPLQCEFCGFTCRQKASLNWHMKKHDVDTFYQFPCDICGQRFEKRDNLAAHRSRKHPASLESAPVETTLIHSSDKVNKQGCKIAPGRFSTNVIQTTTDNTQNVKESMSSQFLERTHNTKDMLQENVQVSDHVQSEISLVIIL
ncbi:zinc finger protein 782 isoform X2 [Xenopus tropicalis]|uniref:E3 ubiquitin-protein ligase ZFP91 n=1 Tax=Xenopus tropicalis TaxID=8364 RepID=A0A803JS38_XENTR|nr:zinc finger protein 782 isoform X2 [Xenopus tropicalis]